MLGRKDRRREAGFHSPKILIGDKFHPCLGFPGILSACPSYAPTQSAAFRTLYEIAADNVAVARGLLIWQSRRAKRGATPDGS